MDCVFLIAMHPELKKSKKQITRGRRGERKQQMNVPKAAAARRKKTCWVLTNTINKKVEISATTTTTTPNINTGGG